jgi:heat-inducible transcriptional repressor
MPATALDDRSREVLRSLIQLHVVSGEPVGSESLSRAFHRSLSPATIRNIMGDLERRGYLDHPHTSAGRIPTDEGYRVYVDTLMSQEPLASGEAATISKRLRARDGSAQQLLQDASHLLSRLSHHVAFALADDAGGSVLRRVDLVRLTHPRILVVLVSRGGLVTSKLIEVEEEITQEQLGTCANYLNTEFAGMSLAEIRGRLMELMREEKALYDSLLKHVISVGERAFRSVSEGGQVYLDGTANILDQPEFEDLDRMRALFKTFEEKSRLVKILNAYLAGCGIRITIGHENPDPEMKDLALVTASYAVDGQRLGLGIMGSTRMEYARMITLVDHVARAVSQALEDIRA